MSCATPGAPRACPPQRIANSTSALTRRAEEYWAAKVAKDWPAVFRFYEPTEQSEWKEDDFVAWSEREEPFCVHQYKLEGTETDGDIGWVSVSYRVTLNRFPDVPPRDVQMWQPWRITGDAWYPVPQRDLENYPKPPSLRDQTSEAALRARFAESWRFRIGRDWRQLHSLIDPRDRANLSEESFARREDMVEYFSHDLHWVEVIGDSGRVRVSYEHRLYDPNMRKLPPQSRAVIEKWVKYEGRWYLKG